MSEYVSISIPETLARRARELARIRHQSLDAVIVEALEQGLQTVPEVDSAADNSESFTGEQRMMTEIAAYTALHAELMADFAGKYVAIFKGQLVDHDANQTALLGRINAEYPDDIVLLKQVRPLPEPDLRIYSPRLERL